MFNGWVALGAVAGLFGFGGLLYYAAYKFMAVDNVYYYATDGYGDDFS